jgi:hypothetical protein
MNNDYLGLHNQVIDLDVISLGDGQWHSIRDFRRDSPADRPDAGNSNDGTRQDIREHRTATHCSHGFSPSFECFLFERCRSHNICRAKSLGSLQRFKSSSTFVSRRIKRTAHPNSNRLVDQSGYTSGQVRVFPINSRARHRHYKLDHADQLIRN